VDPERLPDMAEIAGEPRDRERGGVRREPRVVREDAVERLEDGRFTGSRSKTASIARSTSSNSA